MATEVPKGSAGATIIAEEERLYGQVQARVAMGEENEGPRVGASDLDQDLLSLRDQISEARAEDLPPLIEQMTRLAALRSRLGADRFPLSSCVKASRIVTCGIAPLFVMRRSSDARRVSCPRCCPCHR